ncbi:WD40-repeat-containing domain protein, partial [Coemansia spiralis]
YIYDAVRTDIGIAVSGSNYSVGFYEPSTLQKKGMLKYHANQITQIKARPNSFFSSSIDGQIAYWDLRQALTEPALVFKANNPLLSFDISTNNTLLIGSTQLNDEYNANINFWDLRTASVPIKIYEDSHSDDITQIHCCPNAANQFLSGSTDGLLCTFDVNQTDEDEALLYVANTNASVAKCGYFGPESQFIYAQSDMETLQLWTNDATQLTDFGDVRDIRNNGVPIDYMVGFQYDEQAQRLYMVSGTSGGDIHLLHVGAGSFEHIQMLASGHSAIVRGFDWDLGQGWAVSGGEDGRLTWW